MRLAAECQAAGHNVRLAANKSFGPRAAELGLAFSAIGPDSSLDFGRGPPRPANVAEILDQYLSSQTSELETAIKEMKRCDAIVSSWITPGALIAAGKAGIPILFYFLYPLMLMQLADFPIWSVLRRASEAAKASPKIARKLYQFCKERDKNAAPQYFRAREILRLPQYDGTLFEGPPEAIRFTLFSPHLLRTRQTNAATALLGFVPLLPAGTDQLPTGVRDFLTAKGSPVLISFGSLVALTAGEITRTCCEAAVGLGQSVVIVSRAYDTIHRIAEDVLVVPECPLHALMPSCSAVVTHGGIGTIQDALTAGCPILCIPHFGDHYDNGQRLETFGAGIRLDLKMADVEAVAAALTALTVDGVFKTRAAVWADRFRADNTIEGFREILEGGL